MKNSKPTTNTLYWFDLPRVVASIQPHGCVAAKCILKFRGLEQAHVLLMADGIFSLVAHCLGDDEHPGDDVFVGLGRVIALHAARSRHLLGEAALQRVLRHVESTGGGPMSFDDLPEVTVTLGVAQSDFVECTLRSGPEAALVVLVQDDRLPFGWVRFSSPAPGRRLLSGLGRMLAAQHAGGGMPAS